MGRPSPREALEAAVEPWDDRLIEDSLASYRARGLSPITVDQSYAYPLKGILLPWAQRKQNRGRLLNLIEGELTSVNVFSMRWIRS